MKRFLVGVSLVVALLSFGQWMVPPYGAMTYPASDVEISGTFKGIGTIGGRLVLILDSEGGEINVLAPIWILKAVNFKLYAGEELKIFGKKLVRGDIEVIVPYRFVYKGKEYDMARFYARVYPYKMRARTPIEALPPALRGRYYGYCPYGDGWNWNYHYYHQKHPFRKFPAPGGRMRTPGYGHGW